MATLFTFQIFAWDDGGSRVGNWHDLKYFMQSERK
jgi:hypothetical protein